MKRIILDIVIFFAVIQGWWFVALPLGIVGAMRYPYYLELVVAGLMFDSLFGLSLDTGAYSYAGSIVSIVVFAVVAVLKRFLRK